MKKKPFVAVRDAILRWLIFTVLGGFLPFSYLLYPWMSDKNASFPKWSDFCGRSEMVAVACVLLVAAIGDAWMGLKNGAWAVVTFVVAIIGAVACAGFYGWLQANLQQHEGVTLHCGDSL